ncbi:MAG: sensor histidine kinase [Dehalococcoidia bacterium]|nr:sensor histidine kinase [Dehalococcoidia bacterium]
MTSAIRSLLTESRPARPTTRAWWDWALVGLLLPTTVIEGLLRDDLVWRPTAIAVGVVVVLTLWRRSTHPLLAVVVACGAASALNFAAMIAGVDAERVSLYTGACVLLLPYSLLRWGGGYEAAIGLVIVVVSAFLAVAATSTEFVEALLGSGFFLFSAALGAAVRYRGHARQRDFEQVRLRERAQLARELHDTVAHHVSAIAIQAQAGRMLATTQPDRVLDVFGVIEEAASRTLDEMRTMVGALRDGESPAALAPQPSVRDIEQFARRDGSGARVEVELTGSLDDLSPSLAATLYRIAQEAVTNATRHARHATRIDVQVRGDDRCVRLTVADNGERVTAGRNPSGFGLAGMSERAAQFGGTLEAGPNAGGGWIVQAVLPRRSRAS